jgi:hypothetical protein
MFLRSVGWYRMVYTALYRIGFNTTPPLLESQIAHHVKQCFGRHIISTRIPSITQEVSTRQNTKRLCWSGWNVTEQWTQPPVTLRYLKTNTQNVFLEMQRAQFNACMSRNNHALCWTTTYVKAGSYSLWKPVILNAVSTLSTRWPWFVPETVLAQRWSPKKCIWRAFARELPPPPKSQTYT